MQQDQVDKIYYQGVKDALALYGIWKQGRQVIGCMETPIKDVFNGLEENISLNPPSLDEISSGIFE